MTVTVNTSLQPARPLSVYVCRKILIANLIIGAWVVLLLCGCSTEVSSPPPKSAASSPFGGIPHFDTVDTKHNILRGGQPSETGFAYLKAQHITTILKLNTDNEGSDAQAEMLGMTVVKIPINSRHQIFGPVPTRDIASFWATNQSNVFVHCEHGQDRTGVACYLYERQQGVSKNAATSDMLSHGFHKTLHGLWESVEDAK